MSLVNLLHSLGLGPHKDALKFADDPNYPQPPILPGSAADQIPQTVSPLASLSGGDPYSDQSASAQMNGETYPPTEVTGTKYYPAEAPRPVQYPDSPPHTPNYDNYPQLAGVRQAEKNAQKFAPRHGMFGVKGTLRDVLGLLGDSLLIGSGNKAIYQPQRALERKADALVGFTDNPDAAAERLAAQDPSAGMEFYSNLQKQREMEKNLSADNSRLDKEMSEKVYQQYANQYRQTAGSFSDQASYSRGGRQALQILKDRGGLGEDFVVPETYDKELFNTISRSGMSPYQQATVDDKETSQRFKGVAEAGRNRRDNPPPAPRPSYAPNPTNASEAAPLLRRQRNGTATAGDLESLDRLGYSKDRGKGKKATTSGRRAVAPPSQFGGWSSKPR
jgi:hypothetical protein